MRISKSRNRHRQIAYTVELSEYDAEPPTRTWLLDELPDKVNPELEAVALYLIFGPWCGGEFIVPQKMGPNTASAISRHTGIDFFAGPIEFYPKPIFRGSQAITLKESLDGMGPSTLVLLSSSEWSGSLKSTSGLVLSTNTELFVDPKFSLGTRLAPAVLLAEELNLAEIEYACRPGERTAELAELLRQVGIRLRLD